MAIWSKINKMNYEISENRISEAIYNFINSEFMDDNLDWSYDINPDNEETETNILNFSGDKYQYGDQDEWYFQYVKREYYEIMSDEEFKYRWLNKAPLLDVVDIDWKQKMNNLFGDFWVEPFKKWFKDTYPHFPVKTFIIK